MKRSSGNSSILKRVIPIFFLILLLSCFVVISDENVSANQSESKFSLSRSPNKPLLNPHVMQLSSSKIDFVEFGILLVEFCIFVFLLLSINQDDEKKKLKNNYLIFLIIGITIILINISEFFVIGNTLLTQMHKIVIALTFTMFFIFTKILSYFDTTLSSKLNKIYLAIYTILLCLINILVIFTNLAIKNVIWVGKEMLHESGALLFVLWSFILISFFVVCFYFFTRYKKGYIDKSLYLAFIGVLVIFISTILHQFIDFQIFHVQQILSFVLIISIVNSMYKFNILRMKHYTSVLLFVLIFGLMIFSIFVNGFLSLSNLEKTEVQSFSNMKVNELDDIADKIVGDLDYLRSESYFFSKIFAESSVLRSQDLIKTSLNYKTYEYMNLTINYYSANNTLLFGYPTKSNITKISLYKSSCADNYFCNYSKNSDYLDFTFYLPILNNYSLVKGTLTYDILLHKNSFGNFNCDNFSSTNLLLFSSNKSLIFGCENKFSEDVLFKIQSIINKTSNISSEIIVSGDEKYLFTVFPFLIGEYEFYLTSVDNLKDIYFKIHSSQEQIWAITILSMFISIIFGILINIALTKSLRNEINSKTERIRDLNKHLQKMVDTKTEELEDANLELQKANNTLDQEVKKRTTELKKKVSDLEDMKSALLNIMEDLQDTVSDYHESQKKYKLIVDNMNDVLYSHDLSGKILYVNKNVSSMLGYSPSELQGKNLSLIDLKSSEIFTSIRKSKKTSDILFETTHIGKNKKKVEVSISSKVISTSGAGLVQSIVRDVTDIKKAEDKIKKLNKELERKVKERTKKLSKAKEKIQKLFNIRSQFVNQVAHDLRTPMTPILGLLPLLRKNTQNKKTLEQIDMIENNAKYLAELINKTLDISRLDAGKLKLNKEKLKISNLLDEFCRDNLAFFKHHKIKLIKKVSNSKDYVVADKMRIKEILYNLISNASKYLPLKKEITISLTSDKEFVKILVKDSGIGIEKTKLKKIFEEFYKADNNHGHSAGLGLAISKRIIELHGGKIWAESDGLNKGSTFIFTLPKKNK